jgi:hypothetical protein
MAEYQFPDCVISKVGDVQKLVRGGGETPDRIVIIMDGSADGAAGAAGTLRVRAEPCAAEHDRRVAGGTAKGVCNLGAGIYGEILRRRVHASNGDPGRAGFCPGWNHGGDLRITLGSDGSQVAVELTRRQSKRHRSLRASDGLKVQALCRTTRNCSSQAEQIAPLVVRAAQVTSHDFH